MTTTVRVEAHCDDKTEVLFGVATQPFVGELMEAVTLQNGETAEKYVYDGRIAVVIERQKKQA
jgi:hypothetical protein